MIGFIGVLILLAVAAMVFLHQPKIEEAKEEKPQKLAQQLDKLWSMSRTAIKNKHYLRAEKILLTILRVDSKNADAYNRLGLLYTKEKEYHDAIECFEIAQSLDPNPSNLHNVGLLYFEMGDYERSAQALQQALDAEEDVAIRHVAYAKAQSKLGAHKKAIEHLEKAVKLAPSTALLEVLIKTYRANDMEDKANALEKKMKNSKIKTVRQMQKNKSTI